MANIVRGPLFVNRRDLPIQQAAVFVASSLLVTTLAVTGVIPLPLGATQSLPEQIHHQPKLTLNADTSRGMPQVLRPQTLPVGEVTPWDTIEFPYSVTDTSQESPFALLRTAAAAPFSNAPNYGPVRAYWQSADTSQESSPALLQVVAVPFVPAPSYGPVRAYWQSADTSQESSPALLQVTAAPFVPALWPATPFYPSLLQDSTRGQFISEAVLPVGKSAAWASVALTRNVVDTSQSQSIALRVVVSPPPPGVTLVLDAPLNKNRVWVVVNTSQGTPIGMFPVVVPSTEFAYTFIGV